MLTPISQHYTTPPPPVPAEKAEPLSILILPEGLHKTPVCFQSKNRIKHYLKAAIRL